MSQYLGFITAVIYWSYFVVTINSGFLCAKSMVPDWTVH